MKSFLFLISFVFLCACGVKGDPVPPQVPPPIGRGKPSYSKATMTKPGSKKMPDERDWLEEEDITGKKDKNKANEKDSDEDEN